MPAHPQSCGITGFSCWLARRVAPHQLGQVQPVDPFTLHDGPRRYGELDRLSHGASQPQGAEPTIQDVHADQVLAQTGYKEVPPRMDYELTPLRCSLADTIVPPYTW